MEDLGTAAPSGAPRPAPLAPPAGWPWGDDLRPLVDVAGSPPRAALLAGELSVAGDAAETAFEALVREAGPGGAMAVAVYAALRARLRVGGGGRGTDHDGADRPTGPAHGAVPVRRFTAAQLRHLAEHFGCRVEVLCAPGAAAALAGRAWAGVADLELDRTPGLLDAGEVLLLVATAPPDPGTRSARFFASLPRKAVAAVVLCRDGEGRLLVVHDRFRGAWTVPGGIVDADEDPVAAAAREAWEEGGVPAK
jgi:hypothetical protein